jgi:hypothetical protein
VTVEGHTAESEVRVMDRSVACLALELPGSVYEDVVTKWAAVRASHVALLLLAEELAQELLMSCEHPQHKEQVDLLVAAQAALSGASGATDG